MEALILKFKRYTTVQLLSRANKVQGEELEAILQVLESRSQNTSHLREVPSSAPSIVSEVDDIENRRKWVDDCLLSLASSNDFDSYNVVVDLLGGNGESDVIELIACANVDQLNAVIDFKNSNTPSVIVKKEEEESKEVKSSNKAIKAKPNDGSKSEEILKLLQEGNLSKYKIAKQLGTYYSVVNSVAERYLKS